MSAPSVAELIVEYDATSADTAKDKMQGATGAAAQLEAQNDKLARSSRDAMGSLGGLGQAASTSGSALGGMAAGPQQAAAALGNLDSRAQALRAALNPLEATQARLNGQLAEARALYAAGALGSAEYSRSVAMLEGQLEIASKAQANMEAAALRATGTTRLQTHEAANLGRQFADIGTSLAGGASPFMVLVQQGPQILDIMATSGLGLKGLVREIGLMTGVLKLVDVANDNVAKSAGLAAAGHAAQAASAEAAARAEARLAVATGSAAAGTTASAAAATGGAAANAALAASGTAATVALGPLALVLAAVAAVVGIVAGGFAILTQQINKGGESSKQLQARLGLTDEQMKKVKETSVTMGDTISATFSVIGDRIWDAIGPTMKQVGKVVGDVYQDIVDWTGNAIKALVMGWGGAIGAIGAAWGLLPAAVGDAVVSAVNFVLGAVEAMVNGVIDKINGFINTANAIAGAVAPLIGFDMRLPTLDRIEIGRVRNEFEGAGKSFAEAIEQGWVEGSEAAGAAFDKFWVDVFAKAKANRDKRAKDEAGKGAKAATGQNAGESDYDKALKDAMAAAMATEKETREQIALNKAVADGVMTMAEANRQREISSKLSPFELEMDKAVGAEKALLKEVIDRLRGAYIALDAAKRQAEDLAILEDQDRQIASLKLETSLIGEGNIARAVRLAQFREEQEIMARGGKGHVLTDEEQRRITGAGDIVRQQAALALGQDLYNRALDRTLERLVQIDDLVQSSADRLADTFEGMSDGAAGFTRALGGVLGAMTKLAITEERVNRERADSLKLVRDAMKTNDPKIIRQQLEDTAAVSKRTALEIQSAQLGAYGNMASAAKGFFEENSAGYKAMEAAELAFRAVEFAMSVRAMFQNATETAASVSNSGIKAGASVTAGAAKMFEEGGWFGFIGVAAMLAVMAGLGFSGGSGAAAGGYDLEKVQANQGTGSVLGDASAKSESIANSLELVADHTNDQLEYSNAMLRALRGIESQMESVAAAIARSLGIGGALDPKGVKGLGSTTVNPRTFNSYDAVSALLLGGGSDPLNLFGMTTVKKLVDSGLTFVGQTVGDAMADGLAGSFFRTIETRVTKKAFGFTYSDKVKNKTVTSAIDDDLSRQLGLIVSGLRGGVLAAASVLGIEGAGAVLDAFKLNIGQISFKGMKADEISATLEAVFSKLGDDMAAAVIPGLTDLQKAGEGLFETLMRVARQYQVIDVTLASVGLAFGAVGVSSLSARERLIDLFGSLDEFTDQVGFYAENFLSEAERLAPVQAALNAELTRLGITGLDTRDEFKQLVQGLDVSTAAGAELFAALMAIAPAFAAITEETQEIADARDALSDAYGRERDALIETRDTMKGIFKDLDAFGRSLYSGPTAALTPEQQYLANKTEFDRVRALALGGDGDALADLQNVSEAYLSASRDYFASSAGYFADLEVVRDAVTAAKGIAGQQVDTAEAQLDQLRAMVTGLLNLDETTLSVAQAVDNLRALMAAAFGVNDPTPVTVTPTGTLAPATAAPPPPTLSDAPPAIGGGDAANDNAIVQELQAMNQALTARLARLEALFQEEMNHQGQIASAQLAQGQQTLEALDKTVTALRARA